MAAATPSTPPAVPFLDLRAAYEELRGDLDAAALEALRSGHYILGPRLERFEQEFARLAGARHCIGVSNGLDALHLVLQAWDIGPGDEVLVPSNTFIATWLAVSRVGATPVPVEPDPATHNMDAAQAEAAVTRRTKAIVPVHLYGQPADMDGLRAVAERHGLKVLEDSAQAHGARFRGRPCGSLGDAAGWSFYPGKNLGAFGDGGAITSDDDALAARLRVLRNYGSPVKYDHREAGHNARLDDLQAALLAVKLRHLADWNRRRAETARHYARHLSGIDGLQLPAVPDWAEPVWHLYVVRTPRRDELQADLRAAGVESLIHYPRPPHLQPAYAGLGLGPGAFPVAERLAAEVLSLPMGPHLRAEQRERVVAAVRASFDA